ncbi:hypothetical protein HNR23_003309 [Nocardiopsis mwathae]|uniref:Uncharacterized protein n=1 Tax=Nocardiopsis mwathae TaxID=1472723 RepID=A0A7W9YJK3_9ACTN|nr:hypothetical protein [Nocardiopsis mwathae]MBB6173249.1 hypothetical protein [Nocardiopsis mwathae]
MLYELVRLQKTVDEKKDERQRTRLHARQLRAQLRERARAERALAEIGWSRLC